VTATAVERPDRPATSNGRTFTLGAIWASGGTLWTRFAWGQERTFGGITNQSRLPSGGFLRSARERTTSWDRPWSHPASWTGSWPCSGSSRNWSATKG